MAALNRRLPAALGSVLLAVTGCGQQPQRPADPPGTVTVVVVGDSITEMDSPDFDDGDIGPGSWAAYADGQGLRITGGWAHSGATTTDMLNGLANRALQADALVLLAGNNDIDHGVAAPAIEIQLEQIAARVHAGRVVLSTVAPEDAVAAAVAALNSALPALARAHGWQMVDPMNAISDAARPLPPGHDPRRRAPHSAGRARDRPGPRRALIA